MRYVYDICNSKGVRVSTDTDFDSIPLAIFDEGGYVKVYDSISKAEYELASLGAAEEFRHSLERAHAWRDAHKSQLNLMEEPVREVNKPEAEEVFEYELELSMPEVEMPEGKKTPIAKLEEIARAVDPKHYQSYIMDLQWLEAMQYLPRFRDPEVFKGAVELQIRKYMDRCGGKDDEFQEWSKANWYMRFLLAYMKVGNKPIRVADVEDILNNKHLKAAA